MPRIGSRFAAYEKGITRLPVGRELTRADLLRPRFRMELDGRFEIYYIPFDWLRPSARVMVAGITPGWTQMRLAFSAAARELHAGSSTSTALQAAVAEATFGGEMRTTLVAMLDAIGVPRHLGIDSAAELWDSRQHRDLLQPTSVLRYPVFYDGKNYSGSPKMMRQPLLRHYVETEFVREARLVPDALVLPLGEAVKETLGHLAAEGRIDEQRVLFDLPHPSGTNNGHRTRTWPRVRPRLSRQVTAWFKQHPPRR